MKKIIISLLIVTSITGCSKLNEIPFDQTFASTYYANAAEAESAVVAMYGSFFDLYGGHYGLIGETSGDIMFPRNVVGRASLTIFTYEPTYSVQQGFGRGFESPLAIWQPAYQCIEKANWIILQVPSTPMSVTRRDEIIGEAYFLRALMHWTLAKNFNEVPVKTLPSNSLENAIIGASPKADIYKQIYEDAEKAAAMLPNYSAQLVPGRASKQAAILLHAKAALYNDDWATALTKAKDVLAGPNILLPNYLEIFDITKKAIARREVLFAVEANGTTTPAKFSGMFYQLSPFSGVGVYTNGPTGGFYAYQKFYNTFYPQDKRRLLLDTTFVQPNGTVVKQRDFDTRLASRDLVILGKYKDPKAIGANNSNLFPVLRMADAYLIAAEAEARQNGASAAAYTYLNTIRQRAGIPDLQAGLSRDAFVDSLIKERAWEFFGEADRWYDLTRTNKFLTLVPLATNADYPVRAPQPKHRYFPIPQVEIDANPKLKQNPEWR